MTSGLGIDFSDQPTGRPQLLCQNPLGSLLLAQKFELIALPADDSFQLKIALLERSTHQRDEHDEDQSGTEAKKHGRRADGATC